MIFWLARELLIGLGIYQQRDKVMTQAQASVGPSPTLVSRASARSGDSAGDMPGGGVGPDGCIGGGAVSFRTTLAAALATDGSTGAAPAAADPPVQSVVAPAVEQVPADLVDLAHGVLQSQLRIPGGGAAAIAGAPQTGTGVALTKPRGNGTVRTGRATPGAPTETGDNMAGSRGAKVDGSIQSGTADQGVTVPLPVGVILPKIVVGERSAIGSANPAANGGAGEPGAGPRVGAMEPAGATTPGVAMAPGLPSREEAALPGRAVPTLLPTGDTPGKAAASLGGLAIAPSGQSPPEGLASLFGGAVAGTAPVPVARSQAADAGLTPYPSAASGSVYPQVAPALVSLAGGPAGTRRLTLRLDPVELGLVQIRIDHVRDAPPEIRITADRPETLSLLQRDQLELHRALDQAGIPAEGRQVTFQAGTPLPDVPAQTPVGATSSGTSFSADPFANGPYSGGSGHGQAGQDGARSRLGGGSAEHDLGGFPPDGSGAATNSPRWLRAGVDIFA